MAVVAQEMGTNSYRTLAGEGFAELREKASRFMAYAFHIADEEAFRRKRDQITAKHPSARHICHGWVLGATGERYRAFDAGEPNGSAGKPILRQLQALQLTHAAVVVVRYFGGTLLGKAGLARAFGAAAKEALAQCPIEERRAMQRLRLYCGYAGVEQVKHLLAAAGGELMYAEYGTDCKLEIRAPLDMLPGLAEQWARLGVEAEDLSGTGHTAI